MPEAYCDDCAKPLDEDGYCINPDCKLYSDPETRQEEEPLEVEGEDEDLEDDEDFDFEDDDDLDTME